MTTNTADVAVQSRLNLTSSSAARRLSRAGSAGALQFDECEDYAGRLLRAAEAWSELVDRAILVVLREVVGGLVTGDELIASLSVVPDWLTKD